MTIVELAAKHSDPKRRSIKAVVTLYVDADCEILDRLLKGAGSDGRHPATATTVRPVVAGYEAKCNETGSTIPILTKNDVSYMQVLIVGAQGGKDAVLKCAAVVIDDNEEDQRVRIMTIFDKKYGTEALFKKTTRKPVLSLITWIKTLHNQ